MAPPRPGGRPTPDPFPEGEDDYDDEKEGDAGCSADAASLQCAINVAPLLIERR
jgi:hypothetical protein